MADATLTPSQLRTDADSAKRIRDTVLMIIDPHRFPWVREGREPSDIERERAIIASAVLAAQSDVGAKRRSTSKNEQEHTVKQLLASIGMKEVRAKEIPILTEAPSPGHFCGETRLAGTRADVVARLKDGRVIAIECRCRTQQSIPTNALSMTQEARPHIGMTNLVAPRLYQVRS